MKLLKMRRFILFNNVSSQFFIVSYDIADSKRLRKVARCLEDYGVRVQYSVFECYLTETQLGKLNMRLKKLIEEEEDKLRIYYLCEKDVARIIVDGKGEISKNSDYHIV